MTEGRGDSVAGLAWCQHRLDVSLFFTPAIPAHAEQRSVRGSPFKGVRVEGSADPHQIVMCLLASGRFLNRIQKLFVSRRAADVFWWAGALPINDIGNSATSVGSFSLATAVAATTKRLNVAKREGCDHMRGEIPDAADPKTPRAKNRIGARKDASFKAISTAPTINKTPMGPTMVPIAYPTVQVLADGLNAANSVNFNGKPAYLLDQSKQPGCKGDEQGTGKGIRSGTVSGEVKPTKGSQTVRVEGKHVVRAGDACTMNGGNNPGIYVTSQVPSPEPPKDAIKTSNPPVRSATSERDSAQTNAINWDPANPLQLPMPSTPRRTSRSSNAARLA